MFLLIILILLYIVACRLSFLFIRNAHYHPQGRWQNVKPDYVDILFVFSPFLNIIPALNYLMGSWKDIKYKKQSSEINFFKPKKPY